VDDTWRIGLLAGWLAGRRRVVALGSDVAEEERRRTATRAAAVMTWRTRAESIAVVALMSGCVGNYNNNRRTFMPLSGCMHA
jgi:hypothetical protein